MKRFIALLICAAFIFVISSCEKPLYIDSSNTDMTAPDDYSEFEFTYFDDQTIANNVVSSLQKIKIVDGYLYFFPGLPNAGINDGTTLMKYNCETNNLTTVCSDPLCSHNTPDCK